ncbi:hypothetical protein MAR_005605 [Mya arenaria]|uniref:Uncharacterized protein n=1 Tax=Mya arenaria TaxID=6604 RepID=A0ABY7F000_MYAAR|nr:hypothetical protein MAR_005605 [Mya arenaria]
MKSQSRGTVRHPYGATSGVQRAGSTRALRPQRLFWRRPNLASLIEANAIQIITMHNPQNAFNIFVISVSERQKMYRDPTFSCIERNIVRNGACYGRWYVDIIMSEGKLDNPPMHLIVRELWQKFGLKFDDPRNTFLWIGYECPGDILP